VARDALTGVDGLPDEGQIWVDRGEPIATDVALTTTGVAVEMVVKALEKGIATRTADASGIEILSITRETELKAKTIA